MPVRRLSGVVVDASVAVKWVVSEEHSDSALRLLENATVLAAPAHWLAEAATGLWAACRRGELSEVQAHERVEALVDAPVAVWPLQGLAAAAMRLALRPGITVYDSLYLALAEQQRLTMVTADRRLMDAVRRDRRMGIDVRWIGDA